jgi:predicted aspartyl protease
VPIAVLHGSSGQVLIVAPVPIHGHLYGFILDTGASSTLIDQSIARKLHLRKAGRARRAAGVFGQGAITPVTVSQWQLGNIPLPATRIYATKLGVQHLGRLQVVGLFGSDMLSRFGRAAIDYAGEVLTLGG